MNEELPVVRNDLPTDTNGFSDCVCKLRRSSIDDLAMNLVGIAGIILQTAADFGKILV